MIWCWIDDIEKKFSRTLENTFRVTKKVTFHKVTFFIIRQKGRALLFLSHDSIVLCFEQRNYNESRKSFFYLLYYAVICIVYITCNEMLQLLMLYLQRTKDSETFLPNVNQLFYDDFPGFQNSNTFVFVNYGK